MKINYKKNAFIALIAPIMVILLNTSQPPCFVAIVAIVGWGVAFLANCLLDKIFKS